MSGQQATITKVHFGFTTALSQVRQGLFKRGNLAEPDPVASFNQPRDRVAAAGP